MKIAVSTDNDQVSAHFGRCQLYTIFEIEDNKIINKNAVETPGHQPGMLPKFLHEKGVNLVICGGMGPKAQNLFAELGIEPIIGISGKVDEVVQGYLTGKLQSGESLCTQGTHDHHECQHE
jgi:predicted Fe-Mo cluster-binding NifX family protein